MCFLLFVIYCLEIALNFGVYFGISNANFVAFSLLSVQDEFVINNRKKRKKMPCFIGLTKILKLLYIYSPTSKLALYNFNSSQEKASPTFSFKGVKESSAYPSKISANSEIRSVGITSAS